MAEETLHDQMKAERKYYLGYTDTIPGTNVKVADARKAYRAAVAAEDARMAKRRAEYFEKVAGESEPNTQTTVVTAGVTREVTIPASAPEPVIAIGSEVDAPPDHDAFPTKDELVKLGKDDLVAMAKEAGIDTVPDNMTKDAIADLIIAR